MLPRLMRLAARLAVLALVAVGGMLTLRTAAEASQSQSVTLTFVRIFDPACNCYKARVAGLVSKRRAGEQVVVMEEYCARGSGRSVAGATTLDGGAWQAEISPVARPDFPGAVSYHARWNDSVSQPIVFRGRLASVKGRRLGRGAQEVTVVRSDTNPLDLRGRRVLLQRRVSGSWRRVTTARLGRQQGRFDTFVARFTVPRRGWTLRGFVPARTGAPCFGAQASAPWTS